MNKSLAVLASILVITANARAAVAQDNSLISLKGHWVGTSESIVRGKALHHATPDAAKHLLGNVRFDFAIAGQEGRRFWGTVTSKTGEEPIIGVIALDGKTIVAHDNDGLLQGVIVDADTIDLVYSHTGPSTVVAANRIRRQK